MANAGWLALAVMGHDLVRAVRRLAGHDLEKGTAQTLRRWISTVPGRLVHSGRDDISGYRQPGPWPTPSNSPS